MIVEADVIMSVELHPAARACCQQQSLFCQPRIGYGGFLHDVSWLPFCIESSSLIGNIDRSGEFFTGRGKSNRSRGRESKEKVPIKATA